MNDKERVVLYVSIPSLFFIMTYLTGIIPNSKHTKTLLGFPDVEALILDICKDNQFRELLIKTGMAVGGDNQISVHVR